MSFLYAFDLLELNGADLRREPIEVCKATLASILRKARHGVRLNCPVPSAAARAIGPYLWRSGGTTKPRCWGTPFVVIRNSTSRLIDTHSWWNGTDSGRLLKQRTLPFCDHGVLGAANVCTERTSCGKAKVAALFSRFEGHPV
jgi:hypothetical protein